MSNQESFSADANPIGFHFSVSNAEGTVIPLKDYAESAGPDTQVVPLPLRPEDAIEILQILQDAGLIPNTQDLIGLIESGVKIVLDCSS